MLLPLQDWGGTQSIKMKSVRMLRISRARPREEFDESSTLNMTEVIFKPLGCNDQALKTKTSRNSFQNNGCRQLLVSQDLFEAMGIELEAATKHGEAVD